MLVNHQYRFIFLKTRKTAGTSVEIALSRFCSEGDIVTPLYEPDEKVRRELGFCGPQNYRTALSDYAARDWWRLLRGKRARLKNHATAERVVGAVGQALFDDYFTFSIERDPFDKAVSRILWNQRRKGTTGEPYDLLEALPQRELSNWDIYARGDRVVVDRVLRYETLSEDLREVAEQLRLPGNLELPRTKVSGRAEGSHYSDLLDERCRKLIEERCHREIRAFGYEWSDGPSTTS